MATIKNFEDIEAWQKARELSRAVYACSGKGVFARDYALRDQIRRSVISIISNIAEGFERKKLVSGFMNYLKQSGLKGQKFKKP